MQTNHRSRVRNSLAAMLIANLGFAPPVFAFNYWGILNPDGKLTHSDILASSSSVAFAINAAGQVVGDFYTADGAEHSFITGPNGVGMTDLSTLGGISSEANAINDAGQVVGNSYTADGVEHAFLTGPNGVGMTDLGTLGGSYSDAYGINNAGQVVGDSLTADGSYRPFITGPNGVGMTDLGSPGGVYLGIWHQRCRTGGRKLSHSRC